MTCCASCATGRLEALSPPGARRARDRQRLDLVLVAQGLVRSREQARGLILAGRVLVEGLKIEKAGTLVQTSAAISVREDQPYVSRGGSKLAGALDSLDVDPTGLVCLDVGASTGGFTDCLLQRGARQVFAVDVGYGQLAWSIRQDPRVVVMERTNARYLRSLPEPIQLCVVDASFISLRLLLRPIVQLIDEQGHILALVKPQFEVGRGQVGKRGVVRDDGLRQACVDEVAKTGRSLGLQELGRVDSVLPGPKGNREIFLLLGR